MTILLHSLPKVQVPAPGDKIKEDTCSLGPDVLPAHEHNDRQSCDHDHEGQDKVTLDHMQDVRTSIEAALATLQDELTKRGGVLQVGHVVQYVHIQIII
jgi:hypothetical protein